MCSLVKGKAYILNNSHFPELEKHLQHRFGSDVDFDNMRHLFTELGYEIEYYENLSSKVGNWLLDCNSDNNISGGTHILEVPHMYDC